MTLNELISVYPRYIYTFSCHEDELSLCLLEMRSLLRTETDTGIIGSTICIDPSRSPFIKERVEVIYQGDNLSEIRNQLPQLQLTGNTFKVRFVKKNDLTPLAKIEYEQQRTIERDLGARITGIADVHHPDQTFGIVTLGGRWYFGHYNKSQPIWLTHMQRPCQYSIALPTRIARAAVNIAIPEPSGVAAIDPCCGIGTVLIEALSMGINIVGRDYNPLVTTGARSNIAHFGFSCEVTLGDIADITEHYDAAILDLPYNHVSKSSPEDQSALLRHARRISSRVVVISIAPIDGMITNAGFTIIDRCTARKGTFSRHLMVCI